MKIVTAGLAIIRVIALCYRANKPVILIGRHGVGKSQLFAQAAAHLNVQFISRDLSLMEPTDLIGLPRIHEGRTYYSPPAFLPDGGTGIILFEELNRAARYMQGPCLELLTSRRLNDYSLPPGWLPCAAINGQDEGRYHVDALDEALMSRFVKIQVVPEVREWIAWANGAGQVQETVVDFVDCNPEVFADPEANPRAWDQASDLLRAWERDAERDPNTLDAVFSGTVGDKWCDGFLAFYKATVRPLGADLVLKEYPKHRARVREWVESGRLDLVRASVERLKRRLLQEIAPAASPKGSSLWANAAHFASDLPAELKTQLKAWVEEKGLTDLKVT